MNNNDAQSYTETRRKILDTISLMVTKLQYPPINNTFGHYNRAIFDPNASYFEKLLIFQKRKG
jgi:hypothetical protein